jgi:hypothetical protein
MTLEKFEEVDRDKTSACDGFLQAGHGLQRLDCLAGHVRLELKNVGANYPFERSYRFRGIKPNSGHRDYSPLSCGGGETQLGPSAIAKGFLARMAGGGAILRGSRDDPAASN